MKIIQSKELKQLVPHLALYWPSWLISCSKFLISFDFLCKFMSISTLDFSYTITKVGLENSDVVLL